MTPAYKKSFFWIAVALFLFQYFFLYVDFSNGCFIKITPSLLEWNNVTMKRALRVLKYAAPDDYRKVCMHVRIINPNISCGGFNGGCFHEPYNGKEPGKIDVSTSYGSLLWSAGVIVHETCHLMQYKEHRSLDESECYHADDRILRKLTQFE